MPSPNLEIEVWGPNLLLEPQYSMFTVKYKVKVYLAITLSS